MKNFRNAIYEPWRIGLPSPRSRLHAKVMEILGLAPLTGTRHLVFTGPCATLFFLRPWDLPVLADRGELDLAFCGLDVLDELDLELPVLCEYPTWEALLALCEPTSAPLSKSKPLRVATEFPEITRRYLTGRYEAFDILHIHGAAEAYPHLEGIDAIVDVVESGETLAANGLRQVAVVRTTAPCLIAGRTGRNIVDLNLRSELFSVIAKALEMRSTIEA